MRFYRKRPADLRKGFAAWEPLREDYPENPALKCRIRLTVYPLAVNLYVPLPCYSSAQHRTNGPHTKN